MAAFSDLPVELLLDNVFPHVDVLDLMSLASTCKNFNALMQDDTFWKRRLENDFNFTPKVTARTSGWRFIYKGLRNPRIYVWGEQSCGRLGVVNPKVSALHDVSSPVRLRIPNGRVVNLVAGGMSFHALDSEGNVHVWGALDGTSMALRVDGYSEASKQALRPLRLRLPNPTRAISCGRLHAATLDSENKIWNLISWGRPFRLLAPLLDGSSPGHTPQQIECGWTFTSVLTKTADVLVWFPSDGTMSETVTTRFREMDTQGDSKALAEENEIPCQTWELNMDPIPLPSIPALPRLAHQEAVGDDADQEETRLIRIAGADQYLIGLTNHGHVLKFGPLRNEETASQGEWTYLPQFSEVEKVANLSAFNRNNIPPPKSLKITHISAHFHTFTAYSTGSSSIVLMGRDENSSVDDVPTIIPALQHKDVISVVLGDYHFGALTADGGLYTWGQYSRGALGLGDPTKIPAGEPGGFEHERERLRALERGWGGHLPDVTTPTKVTFSSKRRMFCFSACASGWHTGALVIQLDQNQDDEDEDTSDEEPSGSQHRTGRSDPVPLPIPPPGVIPNILRGRGGFRIGYAGRGANRGGGPGHTSANSQEQPNPGGGSGTGRGILGGHNPLNYFRVGHAGRGGGRGAGGAGDT